MKFTHYAYVQNPGRVFAVGETVDEIETALSREWGKKATLKKYPTSDGITLPRHERGIVPCTEGLFNEFKKLINAMRLPGGPGHVPCEEIYEGVCTVDEYVNSNA